MIMELLMKKKCLIRFASIIILCCLILPLNGCHKTEHIYLPEDITKIKAGNEASDFDSYKAVPESEMSDIVDLIKKQNKLVDKSLNENPVNVKNYFAFRLYFKEKDEELSLIYYIYEKDNKAYIEIPYTGIWEISKDSYKFMEEKINKVLK
jgi:hypothetical protein